MIHAKRYQMRMEVVRQQLFDADLSGVLDLVVRQLHFIGYSHTPDEAATVLRKALRPGSPAVLFVGTGEEGDVRAFAFGNRCCGLECGGDYLWLNELFVLPEHRQKGLGRQMLDFVRSWAKEQGCVYLALVTHPGNTTAISFYEEMGMETESLVWVDSYL